MYDAIDDPYTYENSTVLVNKHDLRDQHSWVPFAPCPPFLCGSSNGGHVIGRAFARPVDFAHPTFLLW
jgi:hypothetical protein